MDLRETNHSTGNRHPWELARIKALRAIARTYAIIRPDAGILDIGCGDGFIIDQLCVGGRALIDAVDIHLSAEQIQEFADTRPFVSFHQDYSCLAEHAYDLITMFDVLEHVPDDIGFLADIIARFAQPGGFFFCTVPAFQSLWCAHDQFLGHHRRYSRSCLHQVLAKSGLEVMASGYLYSSLLPVRMGEVLGEKIRGAGDGKAGIGQWQRGQFLTSAITMALNVDNCALLWLSKMGITVPGLTVWAVCTTSR